MNKENRMMIVNLAEISRIEEFFERMLRDEVNESRRKISRNVGEMILLISVNTLGPILVFMATQHAETKSRSLLILFDARLLDLKVGERRRQMNKILRVLRRAQLKHNWLRLLRYDPRLIAYTVMFLHREINCLIDVKTV